VTCHLSTPVLSLEPHASQHRPASLQLQLCLLLSNRCHDGIVAPALAFFSLLLRVFTLDARAVRPAGTLSSCLQGLLRGGGGVSLSLEQVCGPGSASPTAVQLVELMLA
jgi:hypothetical protein